MNDQGNGVRAETLEVGVYAWPPIHKATIPSCSQMLDVASGGKAVAVVRNKQIEVWDTEAVKKIKAAPFKHTRIDMAQFSPDGKVLAISDSNELVLWRWDEDTHERIDLGRRVGSLTFTPDGKFLAEGPAGGQNIEVRDMATRKIVQTLSAGTKQPMSVAQMCYTQGGRILIACDNSPAAKDMAVSHRIHLWDTTSGTIAHQIALPDGLPRSIDVSTNGRYLAALLDNGASGMKLRVWRLDGENAVALPAGGPPAAAPPR
jgi:WD40 repeat protein